MVLLSDGQIWDADCSAGMPLPLDRWLQATFPHRDRVPEYVRPRFRTVPLQEFQDTFASDRSHMRAEDGSWLHEPPPWPQIGGGRMNLMRFVDMDDDFVGEVSSWP